MQRFQPAVIPAIAVAIGVALFAAILRFGNLCGTSVGRLVWFCAGSAQVEPLPVLSCGLTCSSQDDCPSPMFCKFNEGSADREGVCWDPVCGAERFPDCNCEGPDLVCDDGTVHTYAERDCMVPSGMCTCSGPDLYCPAERLTSYYSVLCYPPSSYCGCNGSDWVCTFHGEQVMSRRDAPQCLAATSTTSCFQLCDPAAPSCDPGLTCTRTEDGVNRCMGGVDSTGYDCTTWPSLTRCWQPCDSDAPVCDPGLTCTGLNGSNYYICLGGIDTTGENCPIPTPVPAILVPGSGGFSTEIGNGVCNDTCDPQASNCQAGLSCLLSSEGSDQYICWNSAICTASDVTPVVTESVNTEAPQQCGPGWLPSGGCACCGTTLVCADGTVAQFNPACMGGDEAAVCGDGVCSGGETCWSCSADCGPC